MIAELALAATLATTGTPAASVEVFWLMPEGATDTNVLWDQTHLPDGVMPCGRWAQVDTYLEHEAATFTADGILTQGEDFQSDTQRGAISWRFVYGGDCAPVDPPVEPDVCLNLDGIQTAIPAGMEAGPAAEGGPTCVEADLPVVSEPRPVVTPPASPVAAPVESVTAAPTLPVTGPELSDQFLGFALVSVGVGWGLVAWRRKVAKS